MWDLALRPSGEMIARSFRGPTIDPDKWTFDPETGEFYRVTFRCGEGSLISTESYRERTTKRLLVIREARKKLIATAVLFLIAAWSRHRLSDLLAHSDSFEHPRSPYLIVDLMLYEHSTFRYAIFYQVCFLVCGLAMLGTLAEWVISIFRLASPSYAAGPMPSPPPGLEEVERQKVHGVGGFATRDEIDQAARGSARTSADDEIFED